MPDKAPKAPTAASLTDEERAEMLAIAAYVDMLVQRHKREAHESMERFAKRIGFRASTITKYRTNQILTLATPNRPILRRLVVALGGSLLDLERYVAGDIAQPVSQDDQALLMVASRLTPDNQLRLRDYALKLELGQQQARQAPITLPIQAQLARVSPAASVPAPESPQEVLDEIDRILENTESGTTQPLHRRDKKQAQQ